jgi:spermidine/putrescine transport system ATP-binding protein
MAISDRIAVMKKGKILQVGTPQELYTNPQHIFVANFIGENNFLEGNVVKTSDGKVQIELRGGLGVSGCDTSQKEGERVVLAIRPETFTIEKGHKRRSNSLFGVVEKVRYEGTNIRYEVRLENEDVVVAVRPSLIEEWFNTGDQVTVSFPSEKSYVFAYPSRGLREELAVE